MHNRYILLIFIIGTLAACQSRKIDFNTEVRPILNKNCISCHGGVKQSGGFGLVFRENAIGKTKNDKFGIVPGTPSKSEMIARITHRDPEMRMPLDREPLNVEEIKILTDWIEQGAEWDDHWAYIQPEMPPIPKTSHDWGTNEIDAFVWDKLDKNRLTPSPKADPHDLIRRVHLDLIGLPPSLQTADAFAQNPTMEAYEEIVDSLLSAPQYGEHWASMWLDLARYADSKGYEADRERIIWKYRDWVIKAFNDNMPFDQFTIEQLAGDLLPTPTIDQLIATAFHRNTLNNGEGGTDNEEYRISSVIDRVNTTYEVWQGTTMSCVQCHSHPYDPIKQKEYYTSFAYFNNTADWDVPSEQPVLREYSEEDEKKLRDVLSWIESVSSDDDQNKWEHILRVREPKLRPEDFDSTANLVHHNRAGQDYMILEDKSFIRIDQVDLTGIDKLYVKAKLLGESNNGTIEVSTTSQTIGIIPLANKGPFQHLPIDVSDINGKQDISLIFNGKDEFKAWIDGVFLTPSLPDNAPDDKINELLNANAKLTTPIMVQKPDDQGRITRVFDRGSWLTQEEEVGTAVPQFLNQTNAQIEDRLELARWLVSNENPLTSRVIVNRFWAKIFGKGLVGTVEDFGTLGDLPTHPKLLDWMATEFRGDWNWDVQQLLKTIVLSETYQQSAVVSDQHKQLDPNNLLYSRSPRVRLTAEQIRDQALSVTNLLSLKMHGPSVMPPQPDGVWSVVYSENKWVTPDDEDAYRRGLYTYIRRSSPYPAFITFDAAEREVCLSRRINTNTPLQALVTLNDPVYMEAAQNLAESLIEEKNINLVASAYETIMRKPISVHKQNSLDDLLRETTEHYSSQLEEAELLTGSSDAQLAALTVTINAMLNMDEFLVKN